MSTISTSARGARRPDDRTLDKLIVRLEAAGNSPGVLRLVERWSESGQPTPAALLAQARALVDLRLMDRAWVRLRELSQVESERGEALALTAEMFVARGWPGRAARLLPDLEAAGIPADRLEAIRRGSEAPPVRPPVNAREIELDGALPEQIALAEVLLAVGSVNRVRGLLQRLQRQHPSNRRVQSLAWGLQGDFASGPADLGALVTELQAGLAAASGWDQAEPTVSFEPDPETAEASRVYRGAITLAERRDRGFRGLFRLDGGAPGSADDDEDDVTMAAVMASSEELVDPPTADHIDPDGVIESGGGDTQIMQIVGSGANKRLEPVSGPAHHKRTDAPTGPLDLRQWRQEHGVVASTQLLDSPTIDGLGDYDDDYLEEEDEDLVVMTRTESAAEVPTRAVQKRRDPISVIDKTPSPPVLPDVPGDDEDTPAVASQALSARAPAPAALPPPVAEPALAEPAPASGSFGKLLVVTGLLAALLAAALTVVVLRGWLSDQQSAAVEAAILDGEAGRLLDAREELLEDLAAGGLLAPNPTRVAARLALVDLAVYTAVSGDREHLAEARALAEDGLSGPEAPVAVAWLEHLEGAPLQLSGEKQGAVAALLLAEDALEDGDLDSATSLLEPLSDVDGARVALAAARAGTKEPSELSAYGSHPLVVLWTYGESGDDLDVRKRLAALKGVRERAPAAAGRVVAQAWSAEARIHAGAGRHEAAGEAWASALKADPDNPMLLGRVATSETRPATAEQHLQRCVSIDPSEPTCQRGLVQQLLTTGRRADAVELIERWRRAGVGVGLLGDWVAAGAGTLDGSPGSADPDDPLRASEALSDYVDALARPPGAARWDAVVDAAGELEGAPGVWDRRLAVVVRDAIASGDAQQLP